MRFDGYDARAYDDEWTRPVDEPAYTTRALRPAPGPGALRHLVFLDGRLLDVWVEPVEGSGYESWAEDLASRERRTVVVPAPQPPLHEEVLCWLDGVVGGRAALLALDADRRASGRSHSLPVDAADRGAEVREHLDRVCGALRR